MRGESHRVDDGGRDYWERQHFRGGLVFKDHRLCVSLNSRLESNKEEEEKRVTASIIAGATSGRGTGLDCLICALTVLYLP